MISGEFDDNLPSLPKKNLSHLWGWHHPWESWEEMHKLQKKYKPKNHTPRKFNIAPENKPSQKESNLPTNHHFSGAMLNFFRGCNPFTYMEHPRVWFPIHQDDDLVGVPSHWHDNRTPMINPNPFPQLCACFLFQQYHTHVSVNIHVYNSYIYTVYEKKLKNDTWWLLGDFVSTNLQKTKRPQIHDHQIQRFLGNVCWGPKLLVASNFCPLDSKTSRSNLNWSWEIFRGEMPAPMPQKMRFLEKRWKHAFFWEMMVVNYPIWRLYFLGIGGCWYWGGTLDHICSHWFSRKKKVVSRPKDACSSHGFSLSQWTLKKKFELYFPY